MHPCVSSGHCITQVPLYPHPPATAVCLPAEPLTARLCNACSCSTAGAGSCRIPCTQVAWRQGQEQARGHSSTGSVLVPPSPVVRVHSCKGITLPAVAQQSDAVSHIDALHTQLPAAHFTCMRRPPTTGSAGVQMETTTPHRSQLWLQQRRPHWWFTHTQQRTWCPATAQQQQTCPQIGGLDRQEV